MYFKFILSFILSLLVVACGDLGKEKVVNKVESTKFNAGCELKIDEFSKILEEPITDQIQCLGKSLDLFIQVVESGKPGYLSKTALETYVQKYVPEFKPENLEAIKTIFDVNHLVFGGEKDYISRESVKKLIDFLELFNKEIIYPYSLYKSEANVSYIFHDMQRKSIFKTADLLSKALLEIFNPDRGEEIHTINIVEVLEAFTTDDSSEGVQKIKSLLFVKKMIFGGDRNVLTHRELQDLLFKLARISQIAFDLVRLKHIELEQKSQLELLLGNLENVQLLLYYPENAQEILFNLDDVIEVARLYFPDYPEVPKYKDLLGEVKQMLMGGDKTYITPKDVSIALERGRDLAQRGAVYHRIYEHFKPYLDSPRQVTINFEDYSHQFPTHEKYLKEFARIVTTYRFFKGSFDSPYYSLAYKRNAKAVVEIGLLEYAFTLLFQRYGTPTEGVGGYGMDVDHMEQLIIKFSQFLRDQEIVYEGREKKAAENATLMASLFQYQSSGDSFVNVNEATEFAVSVFTALDVGDYFKKEMLAVCPGDAKDRVDVPCFRENFYGVLCKKFKPFYPRMFEYFGISSCEDVKPSEDNLRFLKVTEQVARVCTTFKDGTDVPVGKNDMLGVFGALLNIEATLTRFDKNNNNIMDPYEVEIAYDEVYNSAIKAMVKKQASYLVPLSKKIFLYLIKYNKVPDTKDFKNIFQFVKFLASFNQKAPATRETIASILKVISEQGAPETFDCEKLR